jgi:hypothetical protein
MHGLLEPLIAGRSDEWIAAMSQEPNPLAACMEMVGKAYGDLVDHYPTRPNPQVRSDSASLRSSRKLRPMIREESDERRR